MSKRPNGTGYVSRDGTGWVARIPLGWDGPRMVYRKARARTKSVALTLLDQLNRDKVDGTLSADPDQTVAQYLRWWLEDVVRPRVEASTLATYRRNVERHLIPELGKTPIGKLSAQQVQRLLSKLEKGDPARKRPPLAPRTRQSIRTTLVIALNRAIKLDVVRRNVATLTDAPKLASTERPVLSGEQVHALLASAAGERLRPLLVLAAYTGMRRGELLGLSWADVDLKRSRLHVRHALRQTRGQKSRFEPKTEKSKRSFALPAPCVDALTAWDVDRHREQVRAGDRWKGNPWDLVFTTPLGEALDAKAPNHLLARALKAAGLDPIRFHDLRHTAASLLLDAGVDIGRVSDQLGHASSYITATIYRHKIVRNDPTVARTLETLIRPTEPTPK